MLALPPAVVKLRYPVRAPIGAFLLALVLLAAGRAGAQVQETRMNEILHADRSRTSEFAGKSFASSAAYGGKQARVHAFTGGRTAVLRAGDGSFRTRNFAGSESFRTRGFETKADRASGSAAFAQKDRGFATKAVAVQDAPGAGKTTPFVRDYIPGQKSTGMRGKRQDTIDEIHRQKDLSIDEVREILNKPNGRPGTRPAVEALPAMRALPVSAPTAQ